MTATLETARAGDVVLLECPFGSVELEFTDDQVIAQSFLVGGARVDRQRCLELAWEIEAWAVREVSELREAQRLNCYEGV